MIIIRSELSKFKRPNRKLELREKVLILTDSNTTHQCYAYNSKIVTDEEFQMVGNKFS